MRKEKNPLSNLGKKILVANAFLYAHQKIANAEGLLKILNGVEEAETEFIQNEPVFGSMISLKSKRLKMVLHHLVQNGYLRQSYRNETYYFINTDLGDEAIEQYVIQSSRKKKKKMKAPPFVSI